MEENNNITFSILNKCLSLCAMRGSGKSEIMRYLVMAEQHKFFKIFVISPTNITNGFYNNFIQKENIISQWSDDIFVLNKIIIESITNIGWTDHENLKKFVLFCFH